MNIAAVLDPLLFVAGQAATVFCLRSGRPWIGFGGLLVSWTLLDVWLVLHFVFVESTTTAGIVLWSLRAQSAAIASWLAYALWRRRHSAAARSRSAEFAKGTAQYLRSELAAAEATFRGLVRVDPWDAMAWLWLGDVRRERGDHARARRCYRRAASVDRRREHADLLALGRLHELSEPARRS